MGTVISEHPFYLKRFYGGDSRGVCYSLHIDGSFEEKEFLEWLNALIDFFGKEKELSDK